MRANRQNGIDEQSVREVERRMQADGGVPSFEAKLAPEQLASIYRPAKTREEIERDDRARAERQTTRISTWALVRLSAMVTGLFALLLLYTATIKTLWFFGGMAGVSASFVLALLLLFAYYLIYVRIEQWLFRTGRSLKAFLVGYAGIFAGSLLIGGVAGALWPGVDPNVVIIFATIVHGVALLTFSLRVAR